MSVYGIIISIAILTCVLLAEKRINKDRKDKNIFWGYIFWILFGAFFGARLYHVLSEFEFYSQNIAKIFQFQTGGIALIGALAGGIITGTIYLFLNLKKDFKKNYIYLVDLSALYLPLGQAIGRLGNYFNQEIYGTPTNLPWGIYVDPIHRFPEYSSYSKFHPLFAYEALLNIILFAILMKNQKKLGSGTILQIYIYGYFTIRFFLEFLRPYSWTINGINVAQIICLLVVSVLTLINALYHFRSRRI